MGNCCLKSDLQVWPEEKKLLKSGGINFPAHKFEHVLNRTCKFEHVSIDLLILDISEYHFLAGSFKYRSLTFTSKDRQKQL